MTDWSPPLVALIDLQRRAPRGPQREGLLALWLTVRVALDLGTATPEDAVDWSGETERLDLLRRRLGALATSAALQRGLATTVGQLIEAVAVAARTSLRRRAEQTTNPAAGVASAARMALTQLIAPARDEIGPDAADAVAQAVRLLHPAP